MPQILVASGHGNTGGLTALNPQPEFRGIRYAQADIATPAGIFDDCEFVELVYPIISPGDWAVVKTAFGFPGSSRFNSVTLRIVGDDLTTAITRNGRAVRPAYAPIEYPCLRDIVIIVGNLRAL